MRACKLCVNIMSICYTALEKKKKKLNERPRLLLLMSKVSLVFKKSRYNCNSRLSRSPLTPTQILSPLNHQQPALNSHPSHARSAPGRVCHLKPRKWPPHFSRFAIFSSSIFSSGTWPAPALQKYTKGLGKAVKEQRRSRRVQRASSNTYRPLLLSSLLFPVPLFEYLIVLGWLQIHKLSFSLQPSSCHLFIIVRAR